MATEKFLKTRIMLKVDELSNWEKSDLILKNGELAFATTAASTGTELSEPVTVVKIGDGEHKFSELTYNFYARSSDVLLACKSEAGLAAFVNNVIADAGIASSDAMEALAGRVTATENDIKTLKGDENTAGSVAKAIKDAIDALDLANTYVAQEDGKSLIADTEITRLAGMSDGANKVEKSDTNGNIKVDGAEVVVYTHPDEHAISEIAGLQDALDGKQAAGDYAAEVHTHVKDDITDFAHTHTASEVTDFATEVAKVKVAEATKATQDGNGHVIADTYAEKTTTLAGYNIGDAYTKTETDTAVQGAKDYAKGLVDAIPAQTDYTVTITETTDGLASDVAKKYTFTQNGAEIGSINLAKELVVTSGSVKEVAEAGKPYDGAVVGDKYIELVIANQDAPIYVPAKDLVDIYTAKDGATEVQVAISNTNEISATLTDAVKEKLNQAHTHTFIDADVEDAIAKKHSHSFTDEDVNDAISKEHTHSFTDEAVTGAIAKAHEHENADVINGISADDVSAWNAAEQNAKDYADDQIEALDLANTYQAKGDYATTEAFNAFKQEYDTFESETGMALSDLETVASNLETNNTISKANGAVQTVTAATDSGLKATRAGNDIAIEIDDSIVFVFDCGNSEE